MILPPMAAGARHEDKDEDEGIDVVRIRLWNASGSIAVLSDFYSADRVLEKWTAAGTSGVVRFEVTFVDDHVLQGAHDFVRKGKRCCTFSRHVYKLIRSADDAESLPQAPGNFNTRHALVRSDVVRPQRHDVGV